MKRILILLSSLLTASISFGQFPDTAAAGQFIRDTITDRQPDKVTAAQIQKALSGLKSLIPPKNSLVLNVSTTSLRAFTDPLENVKYYMTDAGKEGFWYYDPLDKSSPDNGGTILVSLVNGKRFKRVFTDEVNVKWFGAIGNGIFNNSTAFNLATAATPPFGRLYVPTGTYMLGSKWYHTKPISIIGAGTHVTAINPLPSFPADTNFIEISGGRSIVKNFTTDMDSIGGNWLTLTGEEATNLVEYCVVAHVAANHWGIELRDSLGFNGSALNNIRHNTFFDFVGGAVYGNGGGDQNNITHNIFSLGHSKSHLLKWRGVSGAANLNVSENTMTGAARLIWIDSTTEFKITKNQIEATVPIPLIGSDSSAITISGNRSFGGIIADNNINGLAPNARVGIYFKNGATSNCVSNNTFSVPVFVKTDASVTKISLFNGFGTAGVEDGNNAVSIFEGYGNSIYQGNLGIGGTPLTKLHIQHSPNLSGGLFVNNIGNGQGVNISGSSRYSAMPFVGSYTNTPLELGVNRGEKVGVRIQATGLIEFPYYTSNAVLGTAVNLLGNDAFGNVVQTTLPDILPLSNDGADHLTLGVITQSGHSIQRANLTLREPESFGGSDGGLEFLSDNSGGGFGKRIHTVSDAGSSYDLDFQNRTNSATWESIMKISEAGKIKFNATNTAAGTTGTQTINKPSGTVNVAAAATTLTVTNSTCKTTSIVLCVIRTDDATAYIKNVVPSAGSFTIKLGAAATAEASIGFIVFN